VTSGGGGPKRLPQDSDPPCRSAFEIGGDAKASAVEMTGADGTASEMKRLGDPR